MIENPFYCDERMNWIKQGEEAGWIQFRNISGITRTPECTNFPQTPWDQVVIPQSTCHFVFDVLILVFHSQIVNYF